MSKENTHVTDLNTRKELKCKYLELRDKVISIVGKDVYDNVIDNQQKMMKASFVLEAINDAIDEDPLDIKLAIVEGINSSIEYSVDYFNWDIDFISPKAVAEMVSNFISTLDDTNVTLLGNNLNEFIKITDEMSSIKTKEMLIKMRLNSTYGRSI